MKISDKVLFYIFMICLFLIVIFNWSNKPFYADYPTNNKVVAIVK